MSKEKEKTEVIPTCGIIMPISSIDNCPPEHWAEVLGILKDVCEAKGFNANLVSDGNDVSVIQKRIVENVYSSDIVICDVSCKNANVMFELGMRLAFDKPTIIIKDNITDYSFDTGVIEHIEYPRDLRFNKINIFKELLGKKLVATFDKSKDPKYSTFLQNFGSYKIAHLNEIPISSEEYIVKAIDELKSEVRNIRNMSDQRVVRNISYHNPNILSVRNGKVNVNKYIDELKAYQWIEKEVEMYFKSRIDPGVPFDPSLVISEIVKSIEDNPNAPPDFNYEQIKKIVKDRVMLLWNPKNDYLNVKINDFKKSKTL